MDENVNALRNSQDPLPPFNPSQCMNHGSKANNNGNNGGHFGDVVREAVISSFIRDNGHFGDVVRAAILNSFIPSLPNDFLIDMGQAFILSLPNDVLIGVGQAIEKHKNDNLDAARALLALLRCNETYIRDEYDDQKFLIHDASLHLARKALSKLEGTFRDNVDFRLPLSTNCFECCRLWMDCINRKNECETILGYTESILGNTLTNICKKYNWDTENIFQVTKFTALGIIKKLMIGFVRIPDSEGYILHTILREFDKDIGGLCRTHLLIPLVTQVTYHMKESFFRWHSSVSLPK